MPTRSPAVHRELAPAIGIAILLAAAVLLRLVGIGFTLPHIPEQDGLILPSQVARARGALGASQNADDWARYPHLIAYVAALRPAPAPLAARDASLDAHLEQASAPFALVRVTVAWLSALMVPATWLLARRFMGAFGAFLAAAWIATSVLHVWYSQVASPHGPAAATAAIAVVAAIGIVRTGSLAAYTIAGAAAGVALATLQNGVFVLPPLAAAHFLRPKSVGKRGHASFALALALIGLAYAVFYPRASSQQTGPITSMLVFKGSEIEFFGHTVFLEMFNGQGFVSVLRTLWNLQPVMTAIAAVAVGAWILRRHERVAANRAAFLVVLAYLVPYVMVIGMYERTYERFVLQLLPYVACAAAWGIERATRRAPSSAIRIAIATILVAIPAWDAIALVRLRARPDTATSAARWIASEPGASGARIVLVPFLDLPLFRNDDALSKDRNTAVSTPWRDYQHALGGAPRSEASFGLYNMPIGSPEVRAALEQDPIAHVKSLGAEYVALARPDPTKMAPFFRAMHRALESSAELVHRSPAEGTLRAFDGVVSGGLTPWVWRSLHGFTQVGTVIEVYRLR